MRSAPDGGRRVLRRRSSRRRSTPTRPTSCARRWPACCGPSSSTTTTSTTGSRSAAPIRSSRRGAPRRATSTGTTCTTPTSSRCRTSGSIPWYAAWDLAFHVLALTLVDPDFGKQQLDLMLQRALPAPERADPRLRVELRRRQPAGARLGHDLHLPPREGAHGRGRHRLARALLPQAAAQLHLVGEPQGPLGQQRLRGRLPRPRQHRRVRPQRAAADRRLPRAGRRHRLDGALLPEHARDRRRAGAASDRPTRTWRSSSSSTSCGSPRRWSTPATTSACGTRRTASSTTCCGCPTAGPQRLKVRSMVGLLPLCAVTVFEGELLDEVPGARASACAGSSRRARS